MFFRRPYAKRLTVPRNPDAPWQSEAAGELDPVPRALLIVRPKAPYLNWLKACGNHDATLASARRSDCGAYLIPPLANIDPRHGPEYDDPDASHFVQTYWRHFFAQALELWEPDSALWPAERTYAQFTAWFELDIIDMVLDLGTY